MARIFVGVLILLLTVSSVAWAGWNGNMRVAVHVVSHDPKRTCETDVPPIQSCHDIVTTLEDHEADCFPVFYTLVEYSACEYGLSWPGSYSCMFTSCSDLVIGDIVNPGDGISHAWFSCRDDHVAIPGWAWIYEPGEALICVVEHPTSHLISVVDCSSGRDVPWVEPVCAGIGGAEGSGDPCSGAVSDAPSTWGSIKTLFR
jgi:hypothetical protein